jgi:hypothetical protein
VPVVLAAPEPVEVKEGNLDDVGAVVLDAPVPVDVIVFGVVEPAGFTDAPV